VRPLWHCFAEGALWFTTRARGPADRADVVAGSLVAVSIASEERPYRAVLAYGTPEVWTTDAARWLERIATRYGQAERSDGLSAR
jgi:streptogramin lyase